MDKLINIITINIIFQIFRILKKINIKIKYAI